MKALLARKKSALGKRAFSKRARHTADALRGSFRRRGDPVLYPPVSALFTATFVVRFAPVFMTALFAQSLVTPSLGLIFWKTVAFLIFLYVLYKFGWGPITSSLQTREQEIDHSIQRAEDALAEAKKIQQENKEARRNAEQKAQRILREARDSAEELREEEEAKARRKIQQMKDQAQAEIQREKQAALQELRDEVADLALHAARKIVEDDLDQDRHRELVRDAIDNLPTN